MSIARVPSVVRLFALVACAGLPSTLHANQPGSQPAPAAAPAAARGATASLPERFTQRLPGTTVEFDMVLIPGGVVKVADAGAPGAPGNVREVQVRPMYVSATEVTWDVYDVFVYRLDETDAAPPPDRNAPEAATRPSKPYLPPDRGYGHAGYPAIGMAYKASLAFGEWLKQKTGRPYRVPSEAEWEHLARAGRDTAYFFSDFATDLGAFAWFAENSGEKTQPVGSKQPSPWGLFDVHGNASEWVTGLDGKPTTKGGSYRDDAETLRVAARVNQAPSWQMSDPQFPKSQWWLSDCSWVGIRLVMDADQYTPRAEDAPAKAPGAR
jgi:formylglycine-generating enzyme required for sulfatase activity